MEEEPSSPSRHGPTNMLSCHYCKKRKLRCDRRLPACGRCAEFNRECDYPGQRQANLGKKTQLRDLEAMLSEVGDQVKDLTAKYEALLNQQKSGIAPLPSLQYKQSPRSSAPPSGQTWSSMPGTIQPALSSPPSDMNEQGLPSAELQRQLTEMYFDKLGHASPMILKEDYLESLGKGGSEQPARGLQLIIMALAANMHPTYAAMAQSLYQQARASAEEGEMKDQGQRFDTLSNAQAWLLISNFEAQHAMFARASASCSQAIRMAQVLGLHQVDRTPLPPAAATSKRDWVERESRRRTWWTAFVSDRLIFATTGIPPMIRARDIDTLLPVCDESFRNGQEEQLIPFEEALKNPKQGISPLAARVLAAELFHQALDSMSTCVNHGTPSHAMEVACWAGQTATANSLNLFAMAIPASLQLPGASRSQEAIFVNILINAATICLQKTVLQRGQMCTMGDTVQRRCRERAAVAAGEIVHIFRLSHDLQVSLRNPVLCFAAFTAGLVCLEQVLGEDSPGSRMNIGFILSILNAVRQGNTVAGMLADQLVGHASSIGIDAANLGDISEQPIQSVESASGTSSDFAGQIAAHFVG